MTETINWHGQEFKLREKAGIMRLVKFANMAQSGAGLMDMGALAALYQLVESVLEEGEMPRFENLSSEQADDGGDLMAFATVAIGLIAARPTEVPSSSQSGSESTNESFTVAFSSEESSTPGDLDQELRGLSPIMRDPEVQKFTPVGKSVQAS